MSFDKEVADLISRERGIDPAFVEKDWYAVQVLKALSEYAHETITTIFTGGTSLSKAHGLLERFSEDLDFRARFDSDQPPNRAAKRGFRSSIINALKAIKGIDIEDNQIVTDGLGFKIPLAYPKHFDTPDGIRPELQVEFTYTQPRREAQNQSITSFVSEYKGEDPETNILCLSPVEIAADKVSSLTWRVLKRNRSDEKDDPAMIRHLHDLCALQRIITDNQPLFTETALLSFEEDQQRQNRQVNMSLKEATYKALEILRTDKEYETEYQQFVDEMSYADEDSVITFDAALLSFDSLTGLFD